MRRLLAIVVLAALVTAGSVGAAASEPEVSRHGEIVQTTVDAYIRFLPRYYGELMFRGITGAPQPTNPATPSMR